MVYDIIMVQMIMRRVMKMEKIIINMVSSADKVQGQGVGSAYEEQVALVKEGLKD